MGTYNRFVLMKPSSPVIETLRSQAQRYPKIKKIVLYGSRARGDGNQRSDYDFAVYAKNLAHPQWAKFCLDFEEEAPTLCGIDLLLVSAETPSNLRREIEQEGVIVYELKRN